MGLGDWLKSLVALKVVDANAQAAQVQVRPVQIQPPQGGVINIGGQGDGVQNLGNGSYAVSRGGVAVITNDPNATNGPSAAQWQDDWGPCQGNNPEGFFLHHFELEEAYNDPAKKTNLLRKFGYQDEAHYKRVENTFLKHYGTGDPNAPLAFWVFDQNRVQQAMIGARMKQQQMRQEERLQSNPQLLAPIEGVTIEQYAAIAAQQARGLDQQQFAALLAQHQMDHAKYDRVAAGWMERMSKDTTATIATVYGRAFSGQGAGQYGAAGAAGAAAMQASGQSGVLHTAGGAEPVSFERYCEYPGGPDRVVEDRARRQRHAPAGVQDERARLVEHELLLDDQNDGGHEHDEPLHAAHRAVRAEVLGAQPRRGSVVLGEGARGDPRCRSSRCRTRAEAGRAGGDGPFGRARLSARRQLRVGSVPWRLRCSAAVCR